MASKWDEKNRLIFCQAASQQHAVRQMTWPSDDEAVVEGDLTLELTDITALPNNLAVSGSLRLNATAITTLPPNLSVGADLFLNYSAITRLPNTISVGGTLYLNHTPITRLPNNLSVGGSLYLNHTAVASLPNTLFVGGTLDLSHSAIATLPSNLAVGRSLHLRGTTLAVLPDNLRVGDDLYLRGSAISALPDHLFVGRDLDLRDTAITALPESIFVGRDLDIRGTNIAIVPQGIVTGSVIADADYPSVFSRGVAWNRYSDDEAARHKLLRNYAGRIAAASNPVNYIRELVNDFDGVNDFDELDDLADGSDDLDEVDDVDDLDDLDDIEDFDEARGFAEWVSQPYLAAHALKQATPHWNQEERDEWSQLFQTLGGWKEAARVGGGYPLEPDGIAYGFEIEVRNREALEVRTPHTTSRQRAKDYLEQVKQYFCANRHYFPPGYYWNMHLNISLTAAERRNWERFYEDLQLIAHLLVAPNNPFGRNAHNAALGGTRVVVHNAEPDARCPQRKDAARLEIKAASMHAGLDIDYLFACLDGIKQAAQSPQRMKSVSRRLLSCYQWYGLQQDFSRITYAQNEGVQATLFEKAAVELSARDQAVERELVNFAAFRARRDLGEAVCDNTRPRVADSDDVGYNTCRPRRLSTSPACLAAPRLLCAFHRKFARHATTPACSSFAQSVPPQPTARSKAYRLFFLFFRVLYTARLVPGAADRHGVGVGADGDRLPARPQGRPTRGTVVPLLR